MAEVDEVADFVPGGRGEGRSNSRARSLSTGRRPSKADGQTLGVRTVTPPLQNVDLNVGQFTGSRISGRRPSQPKLQGNGPNAHSFQSHQGLQGSHISTAGDGKQDRQRSSERTTFETLKGRAAGADAAKAQQARSLSISGQCARGSQSPKADSRRRPSRAGVNIAQTRIQAESSLKSLQDTLSKLEEDKAANCAGHNRRRSKTGTWKRRKNSELYRELEADSEIAGEVPRAAARQKPEVLAPAGGWPQLRAAVRAGADAVYFGLDVGLNARARAANFTADELTEVMHFLHSHGVKAYVTLNVLVFDHELFDSADSGRPGSGTAIQALQVVGDANVDALIVQDVGLALACVSRDAANVEIEACRLPYGLIKDGELVDLGDATRYLLSPQDLMALEYVPVLIEAGASCFKIEGRLKGEEYVALTTAAYRQAIDRAWEPDACDAPRLEGPGAELLETPEVTRASLAQVFARGQDSENDGLSPGFLEGPKHQRLVRGLAPKHRGVLVGRVRAVQAKTKSFALELAPGAISVPLRPGAGIFFDTGEFGDDVLGAKISKLRLPKAGVVESSAGLEKGTIVFVRLEFFGETARERLKRLGSEVKPGDYVWRNKDEALEERARMIKLSHLPVREAPPPRLSARTQTLKPGSAQAAEILNSLVSPPLPPLEQQKTTSFMQSELPVPRLTVLCRSPEQAAAVLALPRGLVYELQLDFLEVNGLQESVAAARAALQRVAVCLPRIIKPNEDRLWQLRSRSSIVTSLLPESKRKQHLALQRFYRRLETDALIVRGSGALYQLLGLGDQGEGRESAAVHRASTWQGADNADDEARLGASVNVGRSFTFSLTAGAGVFLQRQISLAITDQAGDVVTEYLRCANPDLQNAANAVTAGFYLGLPGLERLTPTHDLSAMQICQMAKRLGPDRAARLEVVAHQHLPIFHTEHCVFARFLSKGNDFTDCGHPCERSSLHLRDSNGKDHKVLADMGCRNTVFNAKALHSCVCPAEAQSAAMDLAAFAAAGVGPWDETYLQSRQCFAHDASESISAQRCLGLSSL
ncbi:putative protease YrrO [Symbiodinium microadriaticum]|uniref:Putative protease YrrO n=1 Tax=Symbiodinium microadriaticum TaxID=2951 RepID=A0A1Q9ERS7_SYMMI|nr:putative protease YrrO [Symbiodinium microadriaticum]